MDKKLIAYLQKLNHKCPEGFEYQTGGKLGCGKCVERRKKLDDLRTQFKNRKK